MAARVAWFLNLDADLELGAGPRYAPTRTVLAAMQPHVERLARELLAGSDVLVRDEDPPGSARGLAGRAFCPTPRAIARLERAGATPEAHPSVDVLRLVNGRAFAASLGPTLPGAIFTRDETEARATLARTPEAGVSGEWRIKRAFGMAGRGQRVVRAGDASEADLAFLRAALAEGGAQIEPQIAIEEELALHGRLSPDGALVLGRLVRQRCDARGQWLASEPADDLAAPSRTNDGGVDVAGALEREARCVGRALHDAGYFGPFGIDAFTYRDREGALALQPRSEINARYSMGFAVGFR